MANCHITTQMTPSVVTSLESGQRLILFKKLYSLWYTAESSQNFTPTLSLQRDWQLNDTN